ncbi:uncharacterized protein [Ambystoma mexicanum]|uniref:uncharacterized protein n=1 Tax=Ambystoma mexicanum TaxID=8296 RepID=UPI0037E88247
MAARHPFTDLRQDALCSICQEFYKDPVTIDCGHNFCCACLTKYMGQPDLTISCPECKQKFNKKNLKPNKRLANMVESIQRLEEEFGHPLEGRPCEEHGEAVRPPEGSLCGEHGEAARLPEGSLCGEHGEALRLFCDTDETLICLVCRESREHKEHGVRPIQEAYEDYKEREGARRTSLKTQSIAILIRQHPWEQSEVWKRPTHPVAMPKTPKKSADRLRKQRFSPEELQAMVDTLAEHADIVFSGNMRREAVLRKKDIWEQLAQRLSRNMAAAAPLQSLKEEATCSICLEYFTEPVSVECGHAFCLSCITQCWEALEANFPCPQCRETSQSKTLRPYRQLGNMVETLKQLHLPNATSSPPPGGEYVQRTRRETEADKLYSHMEHLQKELKELQEWGEEESRKASELEGTIMKQREKILSTFDHLKQLLEKEKQQLLSRLEKEQEEKMKKIQGKLTRLEEQQSTHRSLITELERKCQQQDVDLLKVRGDQKPIELDQQSTHRGLIPEIEQRCQQQDRELLKVRQDQGSMDL